MSNDPNYIVINKRKIVTKLEEVDIFSIHFYKDNPRINYILSKEGNVDEETIEDRLWRLDSTKKLKNEIEDNGGLKEEIIVHNDMVIEGNTRLCAYRHIYKESPSEEKENWRKIRAKVIVSEIDTKELFQLLGTLHIRGKTQWDLYEKASYVDKMINEEKMSMDELKKIVNETETTITNQLKAFKLMSEYYLKKISDLRDEKTEIKKFSIFEEYFKNSNLQQLKKETDDNVINDNMFADWVLEDRITSAAYHVRKDLYPILKSKKARDAFIKALPGDAVSEAREILYEDKPEYDKDYLKKICEMTDFIDDLHPVDIVGDIEKNRRIGQIIRKFHSTVNKFYNSIRKP